MDRLSLPGVLLCLTLVQLARAQLAYEEQAGGFVFPDDEAVPDESAASAAFRQPARGGRKIPNSSGRYPYPVDSFLQSIEPLFNGDVSNSFFAPELGGVSIHHHHHHGPPPLPPPSSNNFFPHSPGPNRPSQFPHQAPHRPDKRPPSKAPIKFPNEVAPNRPQRPQQRPNQQRPFNSVIKNPFRPRPTHNNFHPGYFFSLKKSSPKKSGNQENSTQRVYRFFFFSCNRGGFPIHSAALPVKAKTLCGEAARRD